MERKKKKLPILEGITIERYAAEGKCVAHFDSVGTNGGISRDKDGNQIRKVLFVPFAAEGDVCDVQILKSRSSYAEGKIVRIVEPSSVRVQPVCNLFGVCGGCKWQHIPYAEQLRFKQQQVMDALQRIGKVELPPCHPIDGSRDTLRYRNKLEFTFSNKKWISFEELDELRAQGKDVPIEPGVGFHIPESFDKVLDIDHCYLQEEISDEVRLWVKQYAIEIGMILTCVLFIKRMSDVTLVTGWKLVDDANDPDSITLRKVPEHTMVYEISGPMFFGAADKILGIAVSESMTNLILRMRSVNAIDSTAVNSLNSLYEDCKAKNVRLILSHVNEQPMSVLEKSGLVEKIGRENFCDHIDAALVRAEKQQDLS